MLLLLKRKIPSPPKRRGERDGHQLVLEGHIAVSSLFVFCATCRYSSFQTMKSSSRVFQKEDIASIVPVWTRFLSSSFGSCLVRTTATLVFFRHSHLRPGQTSQRGKTNIHSSFEGHFIHRLASHSERTFWPLDNKRIVLLGHGVIRPKPNRICRHVLYRPFRAVSQFVCMKYVLSGHACFRP